MVTDKPLRPRSGAGPIGAGVRRRDISRITNDGGPTSRTLSTHLPSPQTVLPANSPPHLTSPARPVSPPAPPRPRPRSKNGLIKQFLKDVHWGQLDYLVVDAPPGTSDEHITITQCLTATAGAGAGAGAVTGGAPGGTCAVIVTTPQDVAVIDVRKEVSFCKKVRHPGARGPGRYGVEGAGGRLGRRAGWCRRVLRPSLCAQRSNERRHTVIERRCDGDTLVDC